MTPQRVQRKRTKGWRMPEGAVYVGRGSKWGNPYPVGSMHPMGNGTWIVLNRDASVDLYRQHLEVIPDGGTALAAEVVSQLAGKDLACWCGPSSPCHADVLLELANAGGA